MIISIRDVYLRIRLIIILILKKVVVGLLSIGYKDDNYISLIHIRYDTLNDELVS